jgi:hypothetical protein
MAAFTINFIYFGPKPVLHEGWVPQNLLHTHFLSINPKYVLGTALVSKGSF